MSSTVTTIKELSIHFTSITLSLTLAGFSIYKLSKNEQTELWIGMLSSVVSLYLPSPLQVMGLFNKQNTNIQVPPA